MLHPLSNFGSFQSEEITATNESKASLGKRLPTVRRSVVYDKEGRPYSVRYDQVNAMLLNELLKEHKKVEELRNKLQTTVAKQQKEIAAVTAQLKEQAAQIHQVSAQVEMSESAAQTVANDR